MYLHHWLCNIRSYVCVLTDYSKQSHFWMATTLMCVSQLQFPCHKSKDVFFFLAQVTLMSCYSSVVKTWCKMLNNVMFLLKQLFEVVVDRTLNIFHAFTESTVTILFLQKEIINFNRRAPSLGIFLGKSEYCCVTAFPNYNF